MKALYKSIFIFLMAQFITLQHKLQSFIKQHGQLAVFILVLVLIIIVSIIPGIGGGAGDGGG